MIKVTRLNGKEFVINAEMIRCIEELPDTTITLVEDKKFIVKETVQEVVARAIAYGRQIRTFQS